MVEKRRSTLISVVRFDRITNTGQNPIKNFGVKNADFQNAISELHASLQ